MLRAKRILLHLLSYQQISKAIHRYYVMLYVCVYESSDSSFYWAFRDM
jgi:hypothetical protein